MRYWLYSEGDILGPYGGGELLRVHLFGPGSLVCPDGAGGDKAGDWRTAESVPELAGLLSAGVASAPAQAESAGADFFPVEAAVPGGIFFDSGGSRPSDTLEQADENSGIEGIGDIFQSVPETGEDIFMPASLSSEAESIADRVDAWIADTQRSFEGASKLENSRIRRKIKIKEEGERLALERVRALEEKLKEAQSRLSAQYLEIEKLKKLYAENGAVSGGEIVSGKETPPESCALPYPGQLRSLGPIKPSWVLDMEEALRDGERGEYHGDLEVPEPVSTAQPPDEVSPSASECEPPAVAEDLQPSPVKPEAEGAQRDFPPAPEPAVRAYESPSEISSGEVPPAFSLPVEGAPVFSAAVTQRQPEALFHPAEPARPSAGNDVMFEESVIGAQAPAVGSLSAGTVSKETAGVQKAGKESRPKSKFLAVIVIFLALAAGGIGYFFFDDEFSLAEFSLINMSTGKKAASSPVSQPEKDLSRAASVAESTPAVQSASSRPAEESKGLVSEGVQKALGIVKNYTLDGGRGTISGWFQNSFLSGHSSGIQEEWSATVLNGEVYVVQYRLLRPRSEPIVYQFEVDNSRMALNRGVNNAAIELLRGGPQPEREASPAPPKAKKPARESRKTVKPKTLPLLPLPEDPSEKQAGEDSSMQSGFEDGEVSAPASEGLTAEEGE